MRPQWDVFCTVVDNYGDIGVTWRLARQLAAEHGLRVRLWVDDLRAFQRICPTMNQALDEQMVEGVVVRRWVTTFTVNEVADVVIEAFACHLPAAYVEAIRDKSPAPLWLNLEYLSAEDWTLGCHGLPSPQGGGLQKFFFFPGFVDGSGGLLRERDVLARRRAFQRDTAAQAVFLQQLQISVREGERLISLFAYENAGLAGWLEALSESQPTLLLVPEGRILSDLAQWFGVATLAAGNELARGALRIHVLPFVSQEDYDRLLWCCDFNAVRGEDSFVRAQWAGRPLLWHIYQQDELAHLEKLEAFLDIYVEGLSVVAGQALRELWRSWSHQGDMAAAWRALLPHWDELQAHAEQWCLRQEALPDLAARLVHFYTKRL